MAATELLYATSAAGKGLSGQASAWTNLAAATGAPDGSFATNNNRLSPGYQRLTLSGYDPLAEVGEATGGVEPYSLDFVHVQVTFTLDSATNYDSIDVLLLDGDGTAIARQPLYLADATTGVTIVGWVNFTGHNGYDDQQRLAWDELDGCSIALDVTRSGAAGADTLRIDAVGMFVAYTVDEPTVPVPPGPPIEVQPPGGGVTLRVYDRDERRLGVLPWSSLSTTLVRNDLGALTASTPKGLILPGLLDGERYLRVAVNGEESPDWFLLDDDGDDDGDEGGPMRPVAIGGSGTAGILDWGLVYSWEYDHAAGNLLNLDPTQGFAGKTPGFILGSLIDQAKERGCFPHLTYSFTDDVDSAGLAWPTIYSRTYDIGTSLLKVLTTMGEDGWVDWEMRGFTLDLYVPDTALAVDRPDVVLRLGKGVTQAPRKRSRKGARSVVLANGGEGAMVELDDGAAIAAWGRRESFEGRSGITDLGTLSAAAQVSLSRQKVASEALTLEMDPYAMPEEIPQLPRPGGFIRYDQRRLSPTKLEPLRLQSLAVDYGDSPKVSVELNDLWIDDDIKRARQLDAILNGSSGNERVPVPPDAPDTLPPGQVGSLGLTSSAYVAPDGTLGAQMTATWPEVTKNADGTPIHDLLGYDIEYRQLDVMPGTHTIRTQVTTLAHWSPVIPGELIDVRIRAVDRYENPGEWTPWTTIRAGDDVTPPAIPSTPQVDNYLGLLRVRWDGAFADGTARVPDLARVEVHLSPLDGFTPDPRPIEDGGTLAGSMYAAGPVFSETPYGELRYAKLVAVDTIGNRSDPSGQASGESGAVVSADIFEGAVGTAQLAYAAVKTANIDDLAVNDAKIGNLAVGKLTAGILNAEVVLGGRIATALTGARVELNSLGIFRWNAAGDLTVAIDDNGALITGEYRTALTGRRIELGAEGRIGRIDFFSPGTYHGFIQSYTENGARGTEAIQIGVQVPGNTSTLWNRMNYNASPFGEYATYKSGSHEFTFDGSSPNLGSFMVWQGVNRDVGAGYQRFGIGLEGETHTVPFGKNYTYNFRSQSARAELAGGGGTASPTFRMFSDNTGGGVRFVDSKIQAVWWDNSGLIPLEASNLAVSSDARGKTEIANVETSLLTKVRGTKVKRYRRADRGRIPRQERNERGDKVIREWVDLVEAPEEIGLLAQEAPAQIVTPVGVEGDALGIDLYQMAAMNWGATTELADIVDDVAAELVGLRAAVAALTKGPK